jgi:hypothetical protein
MRLTVHNHSVGAGVSLVIICDAAGQSRHYTNACRVSQPTLLPLQFPQFPHDSETRKPAPKSWRARNGQPLTDTDYDNARAAFLRNYRRGRGRRAWIRRIHNPGCRQTRLQITPNRARLGAKPGLNDDDIGDADYNDKGKHDRVFYRRWIV